MVFVIVVKDKFKIFYTFFLLYGFIFEGKTCFLGRKSNINIYLIYVERRCKYATLCIYIDYTGELVLTDRAKLCLNSIY